MISGEDHGTTGPRDHGTTGPRDCGTTGQRDNGGWEIDKVTDKVLDKV